MNWIGNGPAGWLVDYSNRVDHLKDRARHDRLNRIAAWLSPRWSVPRYNLGFSAKYAGDWRVSLEHNRLAAELNPDDEAAWWNMGIAATALGDWDSARRAWSACGIELSTVSGEVKFEPRTACVRLNPSGDGEVVWGDRIDPVRLRIANIPLPESGRRFKDIVLHDGASSGTRTIKGMDVLVFDEMATWQASDYSTFEVALRIPSEDAEADLVMRCDEHGMGIEDWSTIRWICAECSRGNPGPYVCTHERLSLDSSLERNYAIAGKSIEMVEDVLRFWRSQWAESHYESPELRLRAEPSVR